MYDYSNDIIGLVEINERCEQHIYSHYKIGKQLTLERSGSEDEKQRMHAFIDACRAWANSPLPKKNDLYDITP